MNVGSDNSQGTLGSYDGTGRIVVRSLRKQFGTVEAVRGLSFTVEPGRVTGFLGPNGAGKTTTLRIVLGLVTPNEGEASISGVHYDQLAQPARVVGAVLDSQGFHRSRTARAHLRIYTAAIGVPDRRADEVLALVGLTDAANRKVGGFSLGMRQRLALATALLGDPQVLVLDEPGSGLDPEGVAWLRGFLRAFASSGRTVLVSSHQLAEIEQTVDHIVIISQGASVYEGSLTQLGGGAQSRLKVQCADQAKLAIALAERGITDVQALPEGGLAVTGTNSTTVGEVALAAGVALYGIAEERTDLERHFFELTSGQYQPTAQFTPPPMTGQVSPVPPGYPQPQPGQFAPQGQQFQQPPQLTPAPQFPPAPPPPKDEQAPTGPPQQPGQDAAKTEQPTRAPSTEGEQQR